jgi:hypothetical protein
MTAVRRRGWAGLLCYTVLTFALSWIHRIQLAAIAPCIEEGLPVR